MQVVRRVSAGLIFGVALFYGMAECNTFTANGSTISCSNFDCSPRMFRISQLEFYDQSLTAIVQCTSGIPKVTEAMNGLNIKCTLSNKSYTYNKNDIETACQIQRRIFGVRVTYNCPSATTTSQTKYATTAIVIQGVTSSFLTSKAATKLANYTPMYSAAITTDDYQDTDSGGIMPTDLEDAGLTTESAANRARDDKLLSSPNTTITRGDTVAVAVCTSAGCLAIVLIAVYFGRRKRWGRCLSHSRRLDQDALSPYAAASETQETESNENDYENCYSALSERSTSEPTVAASHGDASSQLGKYAATQSTVRDVVDVYCNVEVQHTELNQQSLAKKSCDANTAVTEARDEKVTEKFESDTSSFSQSRDSTYFVLEQSLVEPSTDESFKAASPTTHVIRGQSENQVTDERDTFNVTHGNMHPSFQADNFVNAENDLYVPYGGEQGNS